MEKELYDIDLRMIYNTIIGEEIMMKLQFNIVPPGIDSGYIRLPPSEK